jgi:hypothetical protein
MKQKGRRLKTLRPTVDLVVSMNPTPRVLKVDTRQMIYLLDGDELNPKCLIINSLLFSTQAVPDFGHKNGSRHILCYEIVIWRLCLFPGCPSRWYSVLPWYVLQRDSASPPKSRHRSKRQLWRWTTMPSRWLLYRRRGPLPPLSCLSFFSRAPERIIRASF